MLGIDLSGISSRLDNGLELINNSLTAIQKTLESCLHHLGNIEYHQRNGMQSIRNMTDAINNRVYTTYVEDFSGYSSGEIEGLVQKNFNNGWSIAASLGEKMVFIRESE